MRRIHRPALLALIPILAAIGFAPAAGQEAPVTMDLAARIQVRYTHFDPDDGESRGSFGIRRARLGLAGTGYGLDYALQAELAGGSARLLDANIAYRVAPMAGIWLGQGKAPFGRQQLTSSGNLQLVDRAITDARFAPGRQQGVALVGRTPGRRFEYAAGVYNGSGINQPNENDRFMVAGRAVWAPLGAYAPVESAHDRPASPRLALGVAGLRNTTGADETEADVTRLGLEGAFKLGGLSTVAEYYHEWLRPVAGADLDTNGWYVQGGYLLPGGRHELAARYAVISPEASQDQDVVERALGYSLYLHAHRAKLQADLRTIDHRVDDAQDLELRVQFQLSL